MNKLIYLLFISLFSLDWLALKLGVLPRVVTWLPEILSLIAMVLVFLVGAKNKSLALGGKYVIFFFFFFSFVIGGLVINQVDAGVVLVGLRTYLKYLPFFLLPLVYAFTDDEIKKQINFLFFLTILQVPVAIYQRFIKYSGGTSGDVVGGTLGAHTSGVLSVYLACAISILVAFYLKNKVSRRLFFTLLLFLFVPMTLNETKITIFVLPFALLAPVYFMEGGVQKIKKFLTMLLVGIVVLFGFFQVYDHLGAERKGSTLIDWFSESGKVEKYLNKGDVDFQSGEYEVGRFDSIRLAINHLIKEGGLLVGVGIGNASPSFAKKFTGEYYKKYSWSQPTKVYLARVLWEMGIVGVLTYILFFIFVFVDAKNLSKRDDFAGTLSHGWISVTLIVAASFVYFKTFESNLFAYLFWYFSGYLVGQRARLARSESENCYHASYRPV